MTVKELNQWFILQKEELNKEHINSIKPIESIIDILIENINSRFKTLLPSYFLENWYKATNRRSRKDNNDVQSYTVSLILFPYSYQAVVFFKFNITTDERRIDQISVPNYTIEFPDDLLSQYPELFPLYELKVNDDYDINYYFEIIREVFRIYRKKLIMQPKINFLRGYDSKTGFTISNTQKLLSFFEQHSHLYNCPSNSQLHYELNLIELQLDLYTAEIILQWKELEKKQTIKETIYYSRKTKLFSSLLKNKVYLMKRDFFNKPHCPACGTASIDIIITNIFTGAKETHSEFFNY